ncbi:MAG: T9SS type A sorting domain-containing protein, partial [Ferruginibacter sp.]
TGNTIGYSSPAGTGIYSLVGLTTSTLVPISLSVGTTTATSVQGNTIAGINFSGTMSGTSSSAPFRGIYVASGLTVIGNIAGNTIGSQTTTGSITFNTSSTSASDVIAIFNFGSSNWVVSYNEIGGISTTNSNTGAANLYGIRFNTTTTVTSLISNNKVGGTVANSMQSTSSSTATTVQGILATTSIATVTRNIIRNFTGSAGTGTTTTASVIGISFTNTTPINIATENTIYGLANTNSGIASTVCGIQFTGASSGNSVARNLIYGLNNASATGIINGINVTGGTTTYQNNMIRLGLDAAGADIITGAAINGISEPLGTDVFIHNSVYVGGTNVGGASNSFAFNSSQTVNTRNFRNNIFFNARSNGAGTGKHYGIRVGGSAANPTGLTSDYNMIKVSGTGGVFGLFNLVDQATIADWRTATGQDANSIEADPLFVSPTDIHLTTTSPARDAAILVAGVTNDYDGDSRPGTNATTDIGADEFDGIPLVQNDMQATAFIDPTTPGTKLLNSSFSPQASFTNVGVLNQTNVTVRFRILNASNVEVYNQTAVIASLFSGNSATVTFPTAFVASPIGNYSMIAKAELVGDGASVNDSIIGSFVVLGPLAGTYTVGTSGDYPSLTNNGGIFQALNSLGASADIIINIISDLSGELGTNALNQYAAPWKTKIQPFGAARTITGSSTSSLIKLADADGVTIDGSLTNGTAGDFVGGDASLRQLTIINTNVGTSAGIMHIASITNGAKNNIIRNLNVVGADPTTTLIGIAIGSNILGSTGIDNDSNRIENCGVRKAIFGIYAAGASGTNPDSSTVIIKNDLTGSTVDRIRRVGILIFNQDTALVTLNAIANLSTNESADGIGIGVGNQGVSTTIASSGGVSRSNIVRNLISGVASLSTTGFSAAGIVISGSATLGANTIANNMISGITAPATSPDLVAGIQISANTGSNTKLYNNSIALTGDRGTVATQMPSFGVAILGTGTVDFVNNSVYTNQFTTGGGTDAKAYAIGTSSTTFTGLTASNNNYFSTGTNPGYFRSGSLGTAAGTDYLTVASWSTATTQDVNSTQVDPQYIDSAINLHIQPTSPLIGAGVALAAITNDIDGDIRPVTNPAVGADEISAPIPVKVEYIRGAKQGNSNLINYKVSVTYTPSVTLVIERSGNGRNFSAVNTLQADAARCQSPFDFMDRNPLSGKNYYRLKMIDADGTISYSMTIVLINNDRGFELVNLLPNLIDKGTAVLNVSSAVKTRMNVVVTDMAGRMVSTSAFDLIAGSNQFNMNFSKLASGTYQITGITTNGDKQTIRFVKR